MQNYTRLDMYNHPDPRVRHGFILFTEALGFLRRMQDEGDPEKINLAQANHDQWEKAFLGALDRYEALRNQKRAP